MYEELIALPRGGAVTQTDGETEHASQGGGRGAAGGDGGGAGRLLDVGEVAAFLHVSISKVYKMVERGELPAVRIGRTVRVRREDLESAILKMAR